jgi:hypothetical protein
LEWFFGCPQNQCGSEDNSNPKWFLRTTQEPLGALVVYLLLIQANQHLDSFAFTCIKQKNKQKACFHMYQTESQQSGCFHIIQKNKTLEVTSIQPQL